jgi:L-fucose isomerase-like protein
MSLVTVRIGFVPTYRFSWTPWCQKMRDESLAALQKAAGVELVALHPAPDDQSVDPAQGCLPYGAVHDLDEAEAAAEYFRLQKVAGLVLCPLDFGDERSVVKVAELLDVPVLLYATKEPPAPEDARLARVSDSYCGNLSIAAGLFRRKITFRYAGLFFPDEPELLREVEDFARAVAVVSGLRGARIGQVGVRPASFETVGYDEIALVEKFGQNVIHAELSDLVTRARQFADDDPQVGEVIAEIRASVPTITVAGDYLVNAARMELVLTEFWRTNRLSAMAVQCWPAILKLAPISMCALYGRLTGRAMLTACETDILGALSMLVNYQAALGETLPHFIDWTIRHREHPNRLLAWHCGNAPVALARNPATVALRSRRNMTGELPVIQGDQMAGLYQFQVRPGPVTFCRLAEYDNCWKMLVARGEIVPSEEVLAGTWAWVEVRDHDRLYRTLVEEGFIHHASMVHGDQVRALLQACRFLDIQPVLVE